MRLLNAADVVTDVELCALLANEFAPYPVACRFENGQVFATIGPLAEINVGNFAHYEDFPRREVVLDCLRVAVVRAAAPIFRRYTALQMRDLNRLEHARFERSTFGAAVDTAVELTLAEVGK